MKLYVIAVLALLPVRAYAGACETPADAEAEMKSIETAAKSTKATKLTATAVKKAIQKAITAIAGRSP